MAVFKRYNGVMGNQKAKLVAKNSNGQNIFESGLLNHLADVGGVIFPYTPTIQAGHTVNYGTYDLTHTNYQTHFYSFTNNPSISVQANFTAQDVEDATMSAAAMQFFKSMTKMDFGLASKAAGTAGAPPPVLEFTAYGPLNFYKTPVVLKSFTYALPEDPDYITFEDSVMGKFTIPTLWTAIIELGVQIAPKTQKEFNVGGYRNGSLLAKGGWA